jgi:hypothetical protein
VTSTVKPPTSPELFGGRRFSTAMWDFSWATRRSGDEDEYADWPRVLDELADRGYDSVRIDAFPHLMHLEQATVAPRRPRFFWGNHTLVEIRPKDDLVEFVGLCASRDIKVGLSGWFSERPNNVEAIVRTPDDYVTVWDRTLTTLDQAGLTENILWVDLCNEFPLDPWAPGAAKTIFGYRLPFRALPLRLAPWTSTNRERANRFYTDSIRELKTRWDVPFCFSMADVAGSALRTLDVSEFDLAEVHCWATDDPTWSRQSKQVQSLLELPNGQTRHAATAIRYSAAAIEAIVDDVLDPLMRQWANWAAEQHLPLVTTEAWGPVSYTDTDLGLGIDEWAWVRNLAEHAVTRAIQLGWQGICTSNFSQPHHRGMWVDAGWHRELTDEIRGTHKPT